MSKAHSSLSISLSSKIDESNASVTKPEILKNPITFMPPSKHYQQLFFSGYSNPSRHPSPSFVLYIFRLCSYNCLRCVPCTAQNSLSVLKYRKIGTCWWFFNQKLQDTNLQEDMIHLLCHPHHLHLHHHDSTNYLQQGLHQDLFVGVLE